MSKLLRIGDRLINPENVTYIIDREIHFNDGSRWVATEPEIQDLLAIMFETPRPVVEVIEEPLVVKKKTVKKK
jgi:predicted phosphatase